MKKIAAAGLVFVAVSAYAAIANFTGRMEFRTTITGQQAVACEFQYLNTKFWRLFPMGSTCPPSIEVQ